MGQLCNSEIEDYGKNQSIDILKHHQRGLWQESVYGGVSTLLEGWVALLIKIVSHNQDLN